MTGSINSDFVFITRDTGSTGGSISETGEQLSISPPSSSIVAQNQKVASASYSWKVFTTTYSFCGAYASSFYRYFYGTKLENEDQMVLYPDTSLYLIALKQLYYNDGVFLSSTVVDSYLELLKKENPHFEYAREGIFHLDRQKSPSSIALELNELYQENSNLTDLAIPFDYCQHHLVFYIHIPTSTVEYYDPNGLISSDPKSKRKPQLYFDDEGYLTSDTKNLNTDKNEFSLSEELHKIGIIFFGKDAFICENSVQQQKCLFRCGLWGMYFISERLKNKSLQEIVSKPISNSDIDNYKIDVVAAKIKNSANLYLKNKKAEEVSNHLLEAIKTRMITNLLF